MSKLFLSVVIPAYNESSRLEKSLHTVLDYLANYPRPSELIVVDDGSKDDTASIAERIVSKSKVPARVIRNSPNRGKGNAVRTGMLASNSEIVLFSDADLSTPITETPKVIDPIVSGNYEVVFGSRAIDRSLIGVHQPWRREQGGRVFNMVVRVLTGLPFWDTQCGFKAFNLKLCRPVIEAGRVDRFGFDVELLYISYLAGLRLLERGVRWDHNDGSKVNVMRDSYLMFNEVRTIRRDVKRGLYNGAIAQTKEMLDEEKTRSLRELVDTAESDMPAELVSPERRI
jgi:dolichyl-phosphate beta-glucosyltransferase